MNQRSRFDVSSCVPRLEVGLTMQDEHPYPATDDPIERPTLLYCPDCGSSMAANDRFCGVCRWDAELPQKNVPYKTVSPRELGPASDKNRLTTLLLCVFGGVFGLHRFYAGRVGSGLLWLFTFGLLTVGWVYDVVMVGTGEFVDDRGRRILYWE